MNNNNSRVESVAAAATLNNCPSIKCRQSIHIFAQFLVGGRNGYERGRPLSYRIRGHKREGHAHTLGGEEQGGTQYST